MCSKNPEAVQPLPQRSCLSSGEASHLLARSDVTNLSHGHSENSVHPLQPFPQQPETGAEGSQDGRQVAPQSLSLEASPTRLRTSLEFQGHDHQVPWCLPHPPPLSGCAYTIILCTS